MNFKLIVALVNDDLTESIINKAREMGATGATTISNAHGEGLEPGKTFFGLTLEGRMDMILFVVEKHLSRDILEGIGELGHFDDEGGTGMVMQLNIEDAIGLGSQLPVIKTEIEDKI